MKQSLNNGGAALRNGNHPIDTNLCSNEGLPIQKFPGMPRGLVPQ